MKRLIKCLDNYCKFEYWGRWGDIALQTHEEEHQETDSNYIGFEEVHLWKRERSELDDGTNN